MEQGIQPAHTRVVGSNLRPQVAGGLTFGADLGQYQPEDVRHDLPFLHNFHGRYDDTFLEDLTEGADTARCSTPHVYMMGQIGDIAEEGPFPTSRGIRDGVVHRRDEGDVVEVHSTQVGVIGHEGVARAQIFGTIGLHYRRHGPGQRAQVNRLGESLGYGTQLAVEKDTRKISAGLDVGRVGAAPQGNRHFLCRLDQGIADDFKLDRINLNWRLHHRISL